VSGFTFSLFAKAAAAAPLTASQIALKHKLETELSASQPTHRIILRNRRVIEGQIVEETPALIKVRETFGYSGSIVSPVARDQIAAIESLPVPATDLIADDVLLAEAFPAFHFAKQAPYSIVTDAPFAEVERTMRVLSNLRTDFEQSFASLIRPASRSLRIQVVFFNTEAGFRDYALKSAPGLVDSAGFYAARENRLVLLNQLGSFRYAQLQERLDNGRRRLAQATDADPDDLHQANVRLAELRTSVTVEAKTITERLIRHEGAHQLIHAYGLEPPDPSLPTWLSEGLAQFCETSPIGARNETQLGRLKKASQAGTLLPLATLLNHRDPAGFFVLAINQIEPAYAQSWALTYYMLKGPRRDAFVELLKRYRDLRSPTAEGTALVTGCLKTDLATLETEYLDFVRGR
jgi:hypothetical protein